MVAGYISQQTRSFGLTGLTLVLSIILVLATSSGVVRAAAIPPATLPHTAEYLAGRSSTLGRPSVCFATIVLNFSYRGNWIHVKGI